MMFFGALSLFVPVILTACSDDDSKDENLVKGDTNSEVCDNLPNWSVKSRNSSAVPLNLTSKESDAIAGNNQFSTNLLAKIRQANENTLISPFSLQVALSMINNGANEQTQNVVNNALGLKGLTMEEINTMNGKISASLNSELDSTSFFETQNAVWVQEGKNVKKNYYDVIKNSYQASISNLDFSSPSASATIDRWANEATRGLIPSLGLKFSENTFAVISNASYFKASWSSSFTSQFPSLFTKGNGSVEDLALYMHMTNSLPYVETDNYQAVRLPYGNKTFCMDVILPSENSSTTDLLRTIKWDDINFQTTKLDVFLPVFKSKNKFLMKEVLSEMGFESLFSTLLTNIASDVLLDQIQQDTYIEIDMEGTKAAAVTTGLLSERFISPDPSEVIPSFFANRPFIYAIRDAKTGLILFMGEVVNPEIFNAQSAQQ